MRIYIILYLSMTYAYHHNIHTSTASAASLSPFHAVVAAAGLNVALTPAAAVAAAGLNVALSSVTAVATAGLNVALAPAAFISTAGHLHAALLPSSPCALLSLQRDNE